MSWLWSQIAPLWSWWLSEITDMAPALARFRGPRVPQRLAARIGQRGETIVVAAETGEPVTAADTEGAAPLPFELPDALILSRQIMIPRAARSNAAEIAAAKLPWETPFRPDTAYYGYTLGDVPGEKEARLTLIAAPRGAVDHLVETVRGQGIRFNGAGARTPDGQDWVTLIAPDMAARARRGSGAALAAAALVLLALFGPAVSYGLQLRAIKGEIAELSQTAAEAGALRAELRRLTAGQMALSGGGEVLVPRTLAIDRIAALLPSSDWLYRVQIQETGVELFGYADDPGAFIAALSGARDFDAVSFLSPTNRDEATAKQRFHIGAQLTGQP